MTVRDEARKNTVTLDRVRAFWENNPLYAGESKHEPGSAAFFSDHERVTLYEHSGALHPVFVRDVAPGIDLLDVGCGIGFWTEQFARRGARVTACDLTDRACQLTRQRLAFAGLQADVRNGNAEALPFADGSFTHVNCQGVIHHTPNTAQCLVEFHRVLRPGGTLCVSVYYRTLPLRFRLFYRLVTRAAGAVMKLSGRGRETMFTADDPEDLVRLYDGADNPIGRSYTRAEVRQMLNPYFEVLEEVRFGFPRRVLPISLPDRLHAALARRLGLMIAMRCRRRAHAIPQGAR